MKAMREVEKALAQNNNPSSNVTAAAHFNALFSRDFSEVGG